MNDNHLLFRANNKKGTPKSSLCLRTNAVYGVGFCLVGLNRHQLSAIVF